MSVNRSLLPHAATPSGAVDKISAELACPTDGTLRLLYTLTGKINDIRIPASAPPGPADNLWEHTCFEAFIKEPEKKSYYEVNLSPSRQWAAYCFSDYRTEMAVEKKIMVHAIDMEVTEAALTLEASVALPGDLKDRPLQIAISAVIQEKKLTSYWALAHPAEQADFHHPDCFQLQIPGISKS